MSEPAPGPWRVVEPYADGFWGILGADGFPVVVLTTVRQPALANARLIAAAPDLLKALIAGRATHGELCYLGGDCQFILAANAAIAKAQGHQS